MAFWDTLFRSAQLPFSEAMEYWNIGMLECWVGGIRLRLYLMAEIKIRPESIL